MTDTVTYRLPNGSERYVPSTLVPREGDTVMVESGAFTVVRVTYWVKTAANGAVRGQDATVELEEQADEDN